MRRTRRRMAGSPPPGCPGGTACGHSTLGREGAMSADRYALGHFDVNVTPFAEPCVSAASARLTLGKPFAGDLIGTSKGDMWTVDTPVEGSGGYVAIERFDGTLAGHRGSFALLHQGTMDRTGAFQLRIVVVPGSSTD